MSYKFQIKISKIMGEFRIISSMKNRCQINVVKLPSTNIRITTKRTGLDSLSFNKIILLFRPEQFLVSQFLIIICVVL